MAKHELIVQGKNIRYTIVNGMDYVCITDIAKQKNPEFPADVVRNWMRTKSTVHFIFLGCGKNYTTLILNWSNSTSLKMRQA